MELFELSALEIAQKVRAREVTAGEVLEAHLAHIQAVDGISSRLGGEKDAEPDKVHAFITLTAERARNQAAAVDAKIAAGRTPARWRASPFR